MKPQTKFKVSREKLIAAIEAKREAALAAFREAEAQYPVARERYRNDVVNALEDAITAALGPSDEDYGSLITTYHSVARDRDDAYILELPEWPTKPRPRTDDLDKALATLRLSDEETVTITIDDYGRYLA